MFTIVADTLALLAVLVKIEISEYSWVLIFDSADNCGDKENNYDWCMADGEIVDKLVICGHSVLLQLNRISMEQSW